METDSQQTKPHRDCEICSKLGDYEYAIQVGGRESEDTYLPLESDRLISVKNLQGPGGSTAYLKQCPICSTYYTYKSTYEYIVYGSEDEQFLTRLSDEEAASYLQQALRS